MAVELTDFAARWAQALEYTGNLNQARLDSGAKNEFLLPFMTVEWIVAANLGYFAITAVLYMWMKNREKAFGLRPFMLVYNLACVFLAGWVLYGFIVLWFEGVLEVRPVCIEVDVPDEKFKKIEFYVGIYFLQKFFEYIDTWVFILRKSFRQVTFLHIYHHASITVVVWFLLSTGCTPTDGAIWASGYNAFVHVLMYSHYFFSVLKVNTWWRKYLTRLQLIQFCLIMGQAVWGMLHPAECPAFTEQAVLSTYMVTMLVLFSNFYMKAYSGDAKKKSA